MQIKWAEHVTWIHAKKIERSWWGIQVYNGKEADLNWDGWAEWLFKKIGYQSANTGPGPMTVCHGWGKVEIGCRTKEEEQKETFQYFTKWIY